MADFKVIGLMYTRTCPLTCAHCITESAPHVRERMRFEHARKYMRVIGRFGAPICFSGGEPILYYREIAELIREAKTLAMKVSLVTGAGWARSEARIRHRINVLAEAGLDGICISWDQYHEAFGTSDRVRSLIEAATDHGIAVSVRNVTATSDDTDRRHEKFVDLAIVREVGRIVPLGRAASLPESHFIMDDDLPREVCQTIFAPVVEPDGNVYACCGPAHFAKRSSPLLLGNAEEEPLEDILLRAREDPILEIIHNLGPYGLYHLLSSNPRVKDRFERRRRYASICELCLDITNDPEIVNALRDMLSAPDGRRLVAASELWRRASFRK